MFQLFCLRQQTIFSHFTQNFCLPVTFEYFFLKKVFSSQKFGFGLAKSCDGNNFSFFCFAFEFGHKISQNFTFSCKTRQISNDLVPHLLRGSVLSWKKFCKSFQCERFRVTNRVKDESCWSALIVLLFMIHLKLLLLIDDEAFSFFCLIFYALRHI